MNKTLVIFGTIVVIIGVIANIYTETTSQSQFFGLYSTTNSAKPYATLAIPLIIAGIVLLIVGMVMKEDSETKRKK